MQRVYSQKSKKWHILLILGKEFSSAILKKCDIWCHKAYTDKNEKQVGCYVTLDGVETFSDTKDH